jgi:hypothetical protein
VSSHDEARTKLAELRERSAGQLARAARAGQIARKYEGLIESNPASLRPLRERMAQLHRRMEVRHLESARLHDLYAARLDTWVRHADLSQVQPMFIDAVASAIGIASAAIVLRDHEGVEVFAVTSDRTARLAHDLEFVVGEGPTGDVSESSESLQVTGEDLRTRWLRFGPMVIDQGVRAVVGVPLRQEPGDCLGALCVYGPQPVVNEPLVVASERVADALTHTVLNVPGTIEDERSEATSLFDEAAFHVTVNQAAGIVSVHHNCGPSDALALMRARAFADGMPIEALAERVVRGEVRL